MYDSKAPVERALELAEKFVRAHERMAQEIGAAASAVATASRDVASAAGALANGTRELAEAMTHRTRLEVYRYNKATDPGGAFPESHFPAPSLRRFR